MWVTVLGVGLCLLRDGASRCLVISVTLLAPLPRDSSTAPTPLHMAVLRTRPQRSRPRGQLPVWPLLPSPPTSQPRPDHRAGADPACPRQRPCCPSTRVLPPEWGFRAGSGIPTGSCRSPRRPRSVQHDYQQRVLADRCRSLRGLCSDGALIGRLATRGRSSPLTPPDSRVTCRPHFPLPVRHCADRCRRI